MQNAIDEFSARGTSPFYPWYSPSASSQTWLLQNDEKQVFVLRLEAERQNQGTFDRVAIKWYPGLTC
jgi:hypothetical protein